MSKDITVAEHLANFIAEKSVSNVYVLSGGMIAFLTDAIYQLGVTKIVNTRHEQSAGFAAEAESRVTGIPSVAFGTSGPGATNLITAIGSAFFDSTPTIFITGQVHSAEIRDNPRQRQNGFQELDITSAVQRLTKLAVQIQDPRKFPTILESAWEIALEGRPGPVLIDIPIDIQQMKCEKNVEAPIKKRTKNVSPRPLFDVLATRLENSQKPLILAGGGLRSSGMSMEFRRFVEKLQIPVVHTLMGKDILPTSHPMNIGFIGSYGNRWANRALSRADLLLVLGSRLDVRQTGGDVSDFKKNKFIARVDVDSHELNGRIQAELNFNMELIEFFQHADQIQFPQIDTQDYLSEVDIERLRFNSDSEQEINLEISPDACIKRISELSTHAEGFCVDVGQHQMWAAQSIKLLENQRFLTSGGMGAMGFSIPAAIGAASASQKRWVTITGDGCMQLTISELQTIMHYNLPITVFVLNNQQHGMVSQFQEENNEGRFVSTREGYSAPNFSAVADAYGMSTLKVKTLRDFDSVERELRSNPERPLLVEILIQNTAKALPKLDRFKKLSDL